MLSYQSEFVSREETRRSLRTSQHLSWVTPDEWRRLLISHGALERADLSNAGVRGLLDRESGQRFVIEEELLLN